MAINDPRDIAGLVAWYSADAVTGLADGASLTQWADLSGNGNHAVWGGASAPLWQAATGATGGPAIRYPGTDTRLALPVGVMTGVTAGEVMATVKSDTDTGNNGWWRFGGGTGFENHYPWAGEIFDDFGSTGRKSVGNPALAINVWRRANIWSAAGDWAFRLDEGTVYSTVSNTVGWRNPPTIGSPGNVHFTGHYGCVTLYNRKLTTTERADLAAWMAANPSGGVATAAAVRTWPNHQAGQFVKASVDAATMDALRATVLAGTPAQPQPVVVNLPGNQWPTAWSASTAVARGAIVRPSTRTAFGTATAHPHGLLCVAVQAGTTGASEPDWGWPNHPARQDPRPVIRGAPVTDNTVVWEVIGNGAAVLSDTTDTAWAYDGSDDWLQFYDASPAVADVDPLTSREDFTAGTDASNTAGVVYRGRIDVGSPTSYPAHTTVTVNW